MMCPKPFEGKTTSASALIFSDPPDGDVTVSNHWHTELHTLERCNFSCPKPIVMSCDDVGLGRNFAVVPLEV